MGLSVQITNLQRVTVIAVAGEVDVHTAPELRSALTEAATHARPNLVVDLTELDFIDSSGLGILVAARQRGRDRGLGFRLVCPQDRLLKVFRITRLDEVFDIHFTLPDAISATPASRQADQGPTVTPN